MTEFSKRLSLIINANGTSVQNLAKRLDVERPNLHKYINGTRIPTTIEFVEKFANVMMLSLSEKRELIELYKIEKMGDCVYRRRSAIRKILESAARTDYVRSSIVTNNFTHHIDTVSDALPIKGINNVKNMIRSITQMEASRGAKGKILMVVQPNSEFLIDLLTTLCFDSQVRIEHCFCLEKTIKDDSDNIYNINCFQSIFPLLFYGDRYVPMYYYDTIAPQTNLLQYLIITNDCGIGFSSDFQFGILYRSEDLNPFMQQVFQSIKIVSHPVCKTIVSPIAHASIYNDNFENGNLIQYTFEPEPCFGAFLTEELIRSKVRCDLPHNEIITDIAIKRFSLHRNHTKSTHPPVTFFTKSVLDSFMKNGRIAEIPPETHEPFTPDERIFLLEQLYIATQSKTYNAVIVDENKFKLPSNIIISSYADRSVLLVLITPEITPISLILEEGSITYAMNDFLKYLETSYNVLSREETLKIMCETIQAYKKF